MFRKFVSLLLCLFALGCPLSGAEWPDPIPGEGRVLRVDARWRGLFFRVSACTRLSGGRVLLRVQIVYPPGQGPAVALHGEGPEETAYRFDRNAKLVADGKKPRPYTFATAEVRVEATGRLLPRATPQPGDPDTGFADSLYALEPDQALETGGIFLLPPGSNGFQTLSLKIPAAVGVITGVPLLPQTDVNVIGRKFRVKSARELE